MAEFAGSFDANVLLRLLLNDIPEQHKAVASLYSRGRGRFAVADIAVAEIAFVLQKGYGFTRQQVGEAIEGLMALPRLILNRTLLSRALPLYTAHPALSFEDCCLSAYAELSDAEPLFTFDKKLAYQVKNAKIVT